MGLLDSLEQLAVAGETLRAEELLLQMVRRPTWMAGIAADVVGFGAQAVALTIGRLAVVQPLLVLGVVFALPLGVLLSRRAKEICRPARSIAIPTPTAADTA